MATKLSQANSKHLLSLLSAAIIYLFVLHWAYLYFVNPNYDGAHYYYNERDLGLYIFSYISALFPLLFYQRVKTPSNFGASVLYAICYAPGQLLVLFMWSRSIDLLFALIVTWAGSMCTIFWAAAKKIQFAGKGSLRSMQVSEALNPVGNYGRLFIYVFTLISLSLTIYLNIGHISFVGFEDVYDLRFKSAEADGGLIAGYLNMWLNYVFLPYFICVGLIEKQIREGVIGVVIALVLYTTSGAKIAILMPAIIFIYHKLLSADKDVLYLMLLGLVCLCAALAFQQDPAFDMAKSVLFTRILGVSGWTMTTYYDYFTDYGYTYYTHINGIKQLFSDSQVGNFGLGQLIGMEYSRSWEANFNANFWASDGLAAMGVPGIAIITILVSAVMILINSVSTEFDTNFVSLMFVGFWIALSNAPLSTSLLSGGGFVTILLLMELRISKPSPREVIY